MAGEGARMSSRHQTLLAVLLGVGAGGCLGRAETISLDAAVGWKSVASDAAISDRPRALPTDSASADLGRARPDGPVTRLPACGGTVTATGTTPDGSFSAQYVFVSFNCNLLSVDIAESNLADSASLHIPLDTNPQTVWLGETTPVATYTSSGMTAQYSIGAVVDVTQAPRALYEGDAGPTPVMGSFKIETNWFSFSGTFSSQICSEVV